MKKVLLKALIFLISSQALMPQMDLCCEIPKIPALLKHYQEHAHDADNNLITFLAFHYGPQKKEIHHHQDEHDEDLPFKEQPCCSAITLFVPSFVTYHYHGEAMILLEKKFPYQAPLYSEYFHSIFQPPQV
jgi:hypothetical protein